MRCSIFEKMPQSATSVYESILIFVKICVTIELQGVIVVRRIYFMSARNSALLEKPADEGKVVVTDVQRIMAEDLESVSHNDSDLLEMQSEIEYRKIAVDVVKISSKQLKIQNISKTILKSVFSIFFAALLVIQFVGLIWMLKLKFVEQVESITDTIVIAYMSSVFVETLGVILIMVKYAFNSDQEVSILDILNGVIANFQKFKK